jgi:hypothetical protein
VVMVVVVLVEEQKEEKPLRSEKQRVFTAKLKPIFFITE